MRAHYLVVLILALSIKASEANLREAIQEGFAAVRELETMRPGAVHSVQVNGVTETGRKEQFLRRRTSGEILTSKQSCGCGDNALVFLDRIERAGFDALLIDAAEVSSASLLSNFSGHAVVAVREAESKTKPWHLVDSTNLKIISESWSREDRSFEAFGRLFWIGYCGPAAEYPIHSPAELKQFYARTLGTVPPAVLEAALIKLKFTIDPSLRNPNGSLVNPRVAKFVELQETIFEEHEIEPKRTVSVLLKRGSDDARTSLAFDEAEGWIALVGTKSGCGVGLLDYMELMVREHFTRAISE